MSSSNNYRIRPVAGKTYAEDPSAPKALNTQAQSSGTAKVTLQNAISSDLFADNYPGPQMQIHTLDGEYVSQVITEDVLKNNFFRRWTVDAYKTTLPILISAQTGKGKNFFITHTLREYAKKYNERILYVCNRVALNFQQKQELAELTDTPVYADNQWETTEDFDNVTVITYQKLGHILSSEATDFCSKFNYVVLDEAHFFYSDAFFNIHTGNILKKIPKAFSHCFRIYMTATPDNVISPIYSAELEAIDPVLLKEARYNLSENKFKNLDCLPPMQVYTFERDFSAYQDVYFFSTTGKDGASLKKVCDEILSSRLLKMRMKEKWIIFVTSKDDGRQLKKELEREKVPVLYVDRDSSTSKDTFEKVGWFDIQQNGNLGSYDVLITTSVLDNGFSIKDKAVANIVLLTDDKTEFFQELGRVRLIDDQKVRIYISRTTKLYELNAGTNTQRKKILGIYYGEDAVQNENRALLLLKKLWHTAEDSRRRYVELIGADDQYVSVSVNFMAYYRALQIDREIDAYNALFKEDKESAPMLYKLKWLAENPDEVTAENMQYTDADVPAVNRELADLEKFLQSYVATKMLEPKSEKRPSVMRKAFTDFSSELQRRCASLLDETDHRDRSWKHDAIHNHLKILQEKYSAEFENDYKFEEIRPDNSYAYYTLSCKSKGK